MSQREIDRGKAMKIGVMIKTVKFVYAQTGTDISKNWIDPDDIVHIMNPLDEIALEWALKLKDQHPGSSVVAVSLGDLISEDGLRKGLAMGADQALLINVENSDQLDASATSDLLARACRLEKFDLILCGASAIDDNDGLDGPYLAQKLAIPHVTSVVDISVGTDKRCVEVQRVVERGDRQLMECDMPALLTIQKGNVFPRYPSLEGFLRAKASVVTTVKPESLGITQDAHNAATMTEVIGYSSPKPKKLRGFSKRASLPADQRIELMVNRDSSRQKEGGALVVGGSAEMFPRLDRILRDAGVLKQ